MTLLKLCCNVELETNAYFSLSFFTVLSGIRSVGDDFQVVVIHCVSSAVQCSEVYCAGVDPDPDWPCVG